MSPASDPIAPATATVTRSRPRSRMRTIGVRLPLPLATLLLERAAAEGETICTITRRVLRAGLAGHHAATTPDA